MLKQRALLTTMLILVLIVSESASQNTIAFAGRSAIEPLGDQALLRLTGGYSATGHCSVSGRCTNRSTPPTISDCPKHFVNGASQQGYICTTTQICATKTFVGQPLTYCDGSGSGCSRPTTYCQLGHNFHCHTVDTILQNPDGTLLLHHDCNCDEANDPFYTGNVQNCVDSAHPGGIITPQPPDDD